MKLDSSPLSPSRFLPGLVLVLLGIGCASRRTHVPVENGAPPIWQISKGQLSLLDDLQRDTFDFFWKTTNPETGLTPDRVPDGADASIAAVGFGLTAYLVGVERGYVSRPQAAIRTRSTLRFLWQAPQGPEARGVTGYHGFFYHFLDMGTGSRSRGSELSTIDTAILMAGVLSAGAFFDGADEVEVEIRSLAEQLYRRVDWTWAYSSTHQPLLSMGWRPEDGFIQTDWSGYSEGMLLYILALGSPSHPIDPAAWDRWTSTYHWDSTSGAHPHLEFGPLFGHQYSHIWIDFRGIQDRFMRSKGIDYFVNSRRATYANRDYCIRNPGHWAGYSGEIWGLTACEGPLGSETNPSAPVTPFHAYWARSAGSLEAQDDGTLAPTAVGGSVPFAPEVAIPTLEALRLRFGDRLYGEFGFRDAFNLSFPTGQSDAKGWFDQHYLAIDEGPILLMLENYRTGLVWSLMKHNVYVRDGLQRAGFQGGWLRLPSETSGAAPSEKRSP